MKKFLPPILFAAILVGYALFDHLQSATFVTATPTPAQADSSASFQVVIVPSEIVVGPNRFAIGLITPNGLIHDAIVHLRYFDLTNPSAPMLESEGDARRLQTPDRMTTIYAHTREFARAGDWGVEAQARQSDGTTAAKRVGFKVLATSPTLKIGARAPALITRTAAEVAGDLKKLSSAVEPNPAFYRASLAQAITSGKPTVLLFATPAFCQTRLCGPTYEIMTTLQKQSGDAVNFVHVEVFTGLPNPAANNWQLDPAMTAFGLQTEPWLYVMDKKGVIVWRVEGLVTEEELAEQLKSLF